MPAFEAEVGLPFWIDLTTADQPASAEFYRAVLGWDIEGEPGGYQTVTVKGLPIGGFIPQPDGAQNPDTWVTHFLSADIAADCERAERLGGKVMADPRPIERGQMALLVDPTGGLFGLIQPAAPTSFTAGGEPGCAVWHELSVTRDFSPALDFYGELFDWELRTSPGRAGEIEYATAEAEGAAFAGFWNAQGQFPDQVNSFWQTFLGVADLDAAMEQAQAHGGEVIRPAEESPFGRMCLLADATGATVTLVETPPAPEEEPRESDDVLNLGG